MDTVERAARRLAYINHLATPAWSERRAHMRDIAQGRCEWCGSPDNLETHHVHYHTLGREERTDLIVLCDECHGSHHKQGSPSTAQLADIASNHPQTFRHWLLLPEIHDLYEQFDAESR